jgi:hypothetical protein
MNQRDGHFMRMNDLKVFNQRMPRGSKIKNFALLPKDAITHIVPGRIKMRAIRHVLLGAPKKVAVPAAREPKALVDWGKTDDEWKAEADALWAKTHKDGNEHMRVYNDMLREYSGTKTGVQYGVPQHNFSSLHTHPNWDSPLSANDMTSFLSSRNEQISGAASEKAIYIIRKTPDTQHLQFAVDRRAFNTEYKEATKQFTKSLSDVKRGVLPGETKIHLEAGKYMAKKYGFEYKVITRKP